jgi:branched-chain amino acid transport system ATP-binding protein
VSRDADATVEPRGGAGAGESAGPHDGANLDKPDAVLRADGLRKSFGGLVATDDASFAVERGTITGMIGPNGAGKSTLFNLVSGFYDPDAGSVSVNGVDVTGLEPYEISREGLVRTFQTPRRLEGMTVREAMLVGPRPQAGESILPLFASPGSVAAEERRNLGRAEALLERFEIGHLIDEPSTDLSGGQLKLVELARAFMTEPDVLLLDEPVAGVNPTLANDIKRFIRELNEEGQTFLIIEHDMPFIMDLADPIIVLDRGRVLMEGAPEQVRTDERVIDAYLGGARAESGASTEAGDDVSTAGSGEDASAAGGDA